MKQSIKYPFLATIALLSAACSAVHEQSEKNAEKTPIYKPEITISDNVFSPEALWAMGRIGSVVPNEELSLVAYTVSYYSVAENRSTTWVRVCEYSPSNTGEPRLVGVVDEFVGGQPAWTNDGRLLYMKGGKMCLTDWKDHRRDLTLTGFEQPIEGFLLSPDNKQILLVSTVKSHPTTADLYPDLPLASGRVVGDLMYKHWDEWVDEVPQPFLCALTMDKRTLAVAGSRSLLEGTVFESPMRPIAHRASGENTLSEMLISGLWIGVFSALFSDCSWSALQAADKRAIIARKGYLMDCFITCLALRV